MNSARKGLEAVLEEGRKQRDLEGIIQMLLLFSDTQLGQVVKPVLSCFHNLGKGYEEITEDRDKEHLPWLINNFCSFLKLVDEGILPSGSWLSLLHNYIALKGAAQYLPEEFRGSLLVLGAMLLVVRATHARLHQDLCGQVIQWREKTGEPASSIKGLMETYPFLQPVIFFSRVDTCDPRLYYQYFGNQPGLSIGRKTMENPILSSFLNPLAKDTTLKKKTATPNKDAPETLIKDCYALCPLPMSHWPLDHEGQNLWFQELSWPEQQNRLAELQKSWPNFTVRFATIHELMFLDFSARLMVVESPFKIWSFCCSDPNDSSKNWTYGGVEDYGGEIKVDKKTDNRIGRRVMPLFILPVEKQGKEKE